MIPTGLPLVSVTRYVTPLREGGSLPGIVEGDDLGTYVCKFRGAGQGPRVLVAEVIVSELARRLGLRTPRLVILDLDPELARYEADDEGARVLWLDAFTANVDRSWRNPNLLLWHGELWLIDHGACLYFHHGWSSGPGDPARFAAQPWDIAGHVFEGCASRTRELHAEIVAGLDDHVFIEVLADVPDVWLAAVPGAETPAELRAAYVSFLSARLACDAWLPGGAG